MITDIPPNPAADIAERIVTIHKWLNDSEAHCVCPGEHLHSTQTRENHCSVIVAAHERIPVACFTCHHTSCKDVREDAGHTLRVLLELVGLPISWEPTGSRERKERQSKPKLAYLPALLNRFAEAHPPVTPEWLAARSVVDPRGVSPERFLHSLYKSGDKVAVLKECWNEGEIWQHPGKRELDEHELTRFKKGARVGVYFVCNPVSGQLIGKTRRRAECITRFSYVLFESDKAPEGQWLRAMVQIYLPIVAMYRSGSRSIHTLVRVDATSQEEFQQRRNFLHRIMVPLGADAVASKLAQLTRLPGCERLGKDKNVKDENGENVTMYSKYPTPRMQELLYICPDADDTAICDKEVLRG